MTIFSSPIVSAQWLAEHSQQVRIVDARWSIPTGPMRGEYESGHIPGAVFADVDTDLSSPAGESGRHPLPTPEDFANVRGRLGIDRPVVAYDDRSGAVAGRLWWLLDSIGIPAAVLDGGIQSWNGPLAEGVEEVAPVKTHPIPWPEDRFIVVDEVLERIASGSKLVDARSADRFAGRPNPIDKRPGHIPGSYSRPWEENVDEQGKFLSAAELLEGLGKLGISDDAEFIGSCGSGVTGCHNLLAARIAGLGPGRLYTGSWSEWSQCPDRPLGKHA